MRQDEIYAIYDAMITAECCGDYTAASDYNDKLKMFNE